jgi:tRNA (guanine37-N1)-methyltransferase
MSPVVWGEALDEISADAEAPGARPLLAVPTPAGVPFDQPTAAAWSRVPWLVFACGRYEGIDGRVVEHYAGRDDWAGVAEVSLGDYVLAGGEAAALAMVEAVVRLVPGVLGNADSVVDDSFAPGRMEHLVEGPVFTKPPTWRDLPVPAILLSGDHGRIAGWRADQAADRTRRRRPDLPR